MFFSSPKRAVKRYLRRHPDTKLIVVAGSYGRSSAINALGACLGQSFTVAVGVNNAVDADIVILSYDSLSDFKGINADFVVITSATDEASAQKFFTLANSSRYVLVNQADLPESYAKFLTNPNVITYGDDLPANYYFAESDFDLMGYRGEIIMNQEKVLPAHIHVLGEHNLRPVVMAAAVAHLFQVPDEKLIFAIESLRPLEGCLSVYRGNGGTIIIDDSEDTSTLSMELSLRTIYNISAPSRFLIAERIDPDLQINRDLISEVLVLNEKAFPQITDFYKIFNDELSLLEYLATRTQPDSIVLLECHLPAIKGEKLL